MLKAGLAHDRHSGLGPRGFSAGSVRTAQRIQGSIYGTGMEQQMAEAHYRDATADRDLAAHRQLQSRPKCCSERRVWRWGRQAGAVQAGWPSGSS